MQNAIGGGVPQNANTVLAGPTSGGPAAASFSALVGADLPVPFTVPGPVTINTSNQAQPNPIYVPFRDDRKWRSSVAHRTSALTISTFAMGASLGSTNSVPFRFSIVAFDNASTVVLGLINCSAPTQVFRSTKPAFRGRWR